LLQSSGGSNGEIRLRIDALRTVRALDTTVLAHRDSDRVAEIDEVKDSLKLVVAVRPAAGDV
jgi:uncharacterized LabA/DUF88 family protein